MVITPNVGCPRFYKEETGLPSVSRGFTHFPKRVYPFSPEGLPDFVECAFLISVNGCSVWERACCPTLRLFIVGFPLRA